MSERLNIVVHCGKSEVTAAEASAFKAELEKAKADWRKWKAEAAKQK